MKNNNTLQKQVVIHLLASKEYSGAENVACTLINHFQNDYNIFYCSPNGSVNAELIKRNINFIPLKSLTIKEVKRVIKKYKPDIIHAHDYKATIISALFCAKNVKIVSHIHKNDPCMKKVSLKSLLFRLSSRNIFKIIGVSASILDEYIFKNSIKSKYVIIPNYIDSNEILKKSQEYSINEKYDLFYFGRFSPEKNPLSFINIVNNIKQNNASIKAVMIGDGILKKDCEKIIKKYDLLDNIKIVGFKSNPYPYILNSNIGIMPSIYEGFGITAIESLILNKIVLNSGVGGLKEIFKDNSEFICSNEGEYVKKIINIKDISNSIVDISNYTDLNKWKKKILDVYDSLK